MVLEFLCPAKKLIMKKKTRAHRVFMLPQSLRLIDSVIIRFFRNDTLLHIMGLSSNLLIETESKSPKNREN